jgi:putative membrane protein
MVMTDLWLAIVHHVLVFGLAAMLAAEAVLVRRGMGARDAAKVARLDAGYGANAGLVIVVGVLRVIYGAKGYVYYIDNPWFWAKMASFAALGVLSIPPTIRFLAWRKAVQADANFAPSDEAVRGVQTYIRLELALIIVIVAFAATMARYTRI